MKLLENHPIEIIDLITSNIYYDAIFEFSKYEYKPQSLLDTREIFTLESDKISKTSILNIIAELPSNRELALHSRIKIGKKIKHIPMIDFQGGIDEIAPLITRLESILPKKISKEMIFFDSGRSLHAYSPILLSKDEWHDFMGRLLLISMPNENHIIDVRWIGHRIIAGYGSLRWSNNTDQYIGLPKKIRNPLWV